MKRMYVVQALVKEKDVESYGPMMPVFIPSKIKLQWADGMIGVLPVFSNEKDAKKYAGKKFSIAKCEERQVE